jgi:hypothetical protein
VDKDSRHRAARVTSCFGRVLNPLQRVGGILEQKLWLFSKWLPARRHVQSFSIQNCFVEQGQRRCRQCRGPVHMDDNHPKVCIACFGCFKPGSSKCNICQFWPSSLFSRIRSMSESKGKKRALREAFLMAPQMADKAIYETIVPTGCDANDEFVQLSGGQTAKFPHFQDTVSQDMRWDDLMALRQSEFRKFQSPLSDRHV